jgi:hypothetical protein
MSVGRWKFAGWKSSARVGCFAADDSGVEALGVGVGVGVGGSPGGEADLEASGVAIDDDGVSCW